MLLALGFMHRCRCPEVSVNGDLPRGTTGTRFAKTTVALPFPTVARDRIDAAMARELARQGYTQREIGVMLAWLMGRKMPFKSTSVQAALSQHRKETGHGTTRTIDRMG